MMIIINGDDDFSSFLFISLKITCLCVFFLMSFYFFIFWSNILRREQVNLIIVPPHLGLLCKFYIFFLPFLSVRAFQLKQWEVVGRGLLPHSTVREKFSSFSRVFRAFLIMIFVFLSTLFSITRHSFCVYLPFATAGEEGWVKGSGGCGHKGLSPGLCVYAPPNHPSKLLPRGEEGEVPPLLPSLTTSLSVSSCKFKFRSV